MMGLPLIKNFRDHMFFRLSTLFYGIWSSWKSLGSGKSLSDVWVVKRKPRSITHHMKGVHSSGDHRIPPLTFISWSLLEMCCLGYSCLASEKMKTSWRWCSFYQLFKKDLRKIVMGSLDRKYMAYILPPLRYTCINNIWKMGNWEVI